jgi:organic hydroperoxide reductase OsmC/OhrA
VPRQHNYEVSVRWTGESGSGTADYRSYGRAHDVVSDGKPTLQASADPAFLGDPERWNPEEFLVASLSQCHMLTYLALCARHGVVVTGYEDNARGCMQEIAGNSGHFTQAVLNPVVTVAEAGWSRRPPPSTNRHMKPVSSPIRSTFPSGMPPRSGYGPRQPTDPRVAAMHTEGRPGEDGQMGPRRRLVASLVSGSRRL